MKKEDFYRLTSPHLPEAALDYCCDLWRLYKFNLKISRDRKTKLGDFTYHKGTQEYQVTVNRGLNKYAFLITYIHEVAHVYTYRQFRGKVKPHGPEWQQSFRQLAAPLLKLEVFPADILKTFSAYLENPAASTSGNMPLSMTLQKYDEGNAANRQLLAGLQDGSQFKFKERTFIKVGTKRTRALCRDLGNGRNYLIPEAAQVEAVA